MGFEAYKFIGRAEGSFNLNFSGEFLSRSMLLEKDEKASNSTARSVTAIVDH